VTNIKWKMLFLPDFVIHRVFLKGGYGDCVSVGWKTMAMSSQSHSLYARPVDQASGASR
jgi:hypothetical protein